MDNGGEVNWLELPDHLVSLVANKLLHTKDFIRFGAVCPSWRSIYTENRHHRCHQLPLLMLPSQFNTGDNQTRCFYSLSEERLLNFKAPVPHNWFCRGSSHGWLVKVVPENYQVSLFNPFSSVNNEIHLPPLTAFEDDGGLGFALGGYYLVKAVLSANPSSNPNYVVMAIYGDYNSLAFFKPGDKAWTTVYTAGRFVDVTYCRNQFYAINDNGEVFSFDLSHPQHKVSRVAPPFQSMAPRRYLVELLGDLLQIARNTIADDDYGYEAFTYCNCGFDVLKLDPVLLNWIEMDSLHGHALFIGDNSSMSLVASDFPGCKPNSIYFTDDLYECYIELQDGIGRHDMGVFNVGDRSLKQYYPTEPSMIIPPPIWVEPML